MASERNIERLSRQVPDALTVAVERARVDPEDVLPVAQRKVEPANVQVEVRSSS